MSLGSILAVGTGESVPKLLEREVRASFGDTPHVLTASWTSRRCRERLPRDKPAVPSPPLATPSPQIPLMNVLFIFLKQM